MAFRVVLCAELICAGLLSLPHSSSAQIGDLHGKASVAAASSNEGSTREVRARYRPEWSGGITLSSSLTLDGFASANLWESRVWPEAGAAESDDGIDPYRAWVRLSAPRFEVRAGLQKITFGSATVFRPLMWFDRVDPRDPLQLSEGVWGVLGRIYLPDNVTAWAWGVVGEDERKGWELVPSESGVAEGGGRLQVPFGPGELAATYHHRSFDVTSLAAVDPGMTATGTEDRFGIDGRWDLGIGFWVEAAFARRTSEIVEQRWTRAWSVGTDYTLGLGNGLTVLAEHFDQEAPTLLTAPGGAPPEGPGDGTARDVPPSPDIRLTSFTANYPVGVLDRLALAIYRDWEGSSWLRLLEWRRTYDRWRIHLLGFWNPGGDTLFPSAGRDGATRSSALTGKGAQLIVVFNH